VALAQSVIARYAEARVPVTMAQNSVTPLISQDMPKLVMVYGDQERLDRMLVNLLDNATRYADSAVSVSVARSGLWAELSVTDDGQGIPEADRERAFDRFARLDNARTRDTDDYGGAGLGLAIVRATAQAYQGTAYLTEATPPPGLQATVRLPAAIAYPRSTASLTPEHACASGP
jgi:signal transduction histidine kinase